MQLPFLLAEIFVMCYKQMKLLTSQEAKHSVQVIFFCFFPSSHLLSWKNKPNSLREGEEEEGKSNLAE